MHFISEHAVSILLLIVNLTWMEILICNCNVIMIILLLSTQFWSGETFTVTYFSKHKLLQSQEQISLNHRKILTLKGVILFLWMAERLVPLHVLEYFSICLVCEAAALKPSGAMLDETV